MKVGPQVDAPFRVPIEVQRVEKAYIEQQREHVAQFKERRLVRAYQNWLGRDLDAYAIPFGQTILRTDAYDDKRNLLIEAKSNAQRPSLRMAVGQLWDCARYLSPPPRLAILLPQKPDQDGMAFLKHCRVTTIWQSKAGFQEKII